MSTPNAVVIFNGTTQHTFSAKANCLVTLNPGQNVVSLAKIAALSGETDSTDEEEIKIATRCTSEAFVEMIIDGTIKVINGKGIDANTTEGVNTSGTKDASEDTINVDIVQLGARDAAAIIKEVTDVSIVQGYLDAENLSGDPRPTVVKACEKAIKTLTVD
jgi:hypothetical protein